MAVVWNQQVVTWTGDGTNGRLIPTTFPLNAGVVAIWILPQGSDTPIFRHTGMPGSMYANTSVDTSNGIMAFQVGGFTINNTVGGGSTHCNAVATKYTGVVLQDLSIANLYMRVGGYAPWDTKSWVGNCVLGNNTVTAVANILGSDVGRHAVLTIDHVIIGANPLGMAMDIAPTPELPGSQTFNSVPATDQARHIATGYASPPTQMFVFGNGVPAWRDSDFPGLTSSLLSDTVVDPATLITSMPSYFTAGGDSNVNGASAGELWWVALRIPPGDPIEAFLKTYSAVGTGASVTVGGFAFTPVFAIAHEVVASGFSYNLWRGPLNAGVPSQHFTPAASEATGGITAFGAGTLTLGVTVAPAGKTVYGFAMAAAGSVSSASQFPALTVIW